MGMIELSFSPAYGDLTLDIEVQGHVLTLNGDVLDLSFMQDGDHLPQEALSGDAAELILSGIEMLDGVIRMTVLLPYHTATPSEWERFPTPVVLEDGVFVRPTEGTEP